MAAEVSTHQPADHVNKISPNLTLHTALVLFMKKSKLMNELDNLAEYHKETRKEKVD